MGSERPYGLVLRQDFEVMERQLRDKTREAWQDKYREAAGLLKDHFPGEWSRIQNCGMAFERRAWVPDAKWGKLQPMRCHNVPFCLPCVEYAHRLRLNGWFNSLERVTPAGLPLRLSQVTQTAPLNADGEGWGAAASRNVSKFRKVVGAHLREWYGEGIGVVMSYQDFGEQGFSKRHPHLHMTVSGYRLLDGKVSVVQDPDLAGSGRGRWDEGMAARATVFGDWSGWHSGGSLDVIPFKQGRAEYNKLLRYQLRELVDLSKIEYQPSKRRLLWKSGTGPEVAGMDVLDFKARLLEYKLRLGVWERSQKTGGVKKLHVGFGILGDAAIGAAQEAIGGVESDHKPDCACGKCQEWYREEYTPNEIFVLGDV